MQVEALTVTATLEDEETRSQIKKDGQTYVLDGMLAVRNDPWQVTGGFHCFRGWHSTH